MSFDFSHDWMIAKRLFETATGKKKPGKKFLGAFKMSSGVEEACKGLEKAIESPSGDRIAKAEKSFNKAAEDYLKVLRKAARGIELELKCTADPELYDAPLTLITEVPADWKEVIVSQGEAKTTLEAKDGKVTFDALPGVVRLAAQ